MRVLVIQHDPDKGLGQFVQPLAEASLELDVRFAGHGEIELLDHVGVIALPGVANPADESPAIISTRDVLRDALAQGVPVFGICLGAELLAEAAGGLTRPCPMEWGYRPVSLEPAAGDDDLLADLPAEFEVFQAHGVRFDLPVGAVPLARSPGAVEAFRIGSNAWGVQFHPEPTLEMLDGWTHSLGDAMRASGVDPALVRREARRRVPEWHVHAGAMGRRFAAVARAARLTST